MANLVLLALPFIVLSARAVVPPQPSLDDILKHEAEYCQRLELAALDFVCLEDITEKIDQSKDIKLVRWPTLRDVPPTSVKRTFLYDFQYVRKDGRIKETRTLLKKNGRASMIKDAKLETGNFIYENAVLAPVGIFGSQWREAFAYKIIGEAKVGGRPCLIVEAALKDSGPEVDFLFGRAYIEKNTLNILRIDWNEKKIGNYDAFELRGKRYGMKPRLSVISEFEIEKNGIRFPTRHLIEEAYYGVGGMETTGKFIRSRTTVVYKDFKFFTVTVQRN